MKDLNCKSHNNQEDAICEIESDQDTSRNSTAVNYQDKLLLIQNLAITKAVRVNKAASHKKLATSMKNALVSIETKMEKQEDARLKRLPSLFQEDTITTPQSLHNSKHRIKDVMTQTLPTIPELDVVPDTQHRAAFDYIKKRIIHLALQKRENKILQNMFNLMIKKVSKLGSIYIEKTSKQGSCA